METKNSYAQSFTFISLGLDRMETNSRLVGKTHVEYDRSQEERNIVTWIHDWNHSLIKNRNFKHYVRKHTSTELSHQRYSSLVIEASITVNAIRASYWSSSPEPNNWALIMQRQIRNVRSQLSYSFVQMTSTVLAQGAFFVVLVKW